MATPLASTESAANAIQRVKYSHDAMIDMILADPRTKQGEIARHFGVTQGWVSRVFCSDAFQARLAERKSELVDPTLLDTIENNLRGLIHQGSEILAEKLETSRSPDLALKAMEIGGKLLGYGAKKDNVNLQQNFIAVVPAKAGSVQEWVEAHRPPQAKVEVVEAKVISATPSQLTDLAALSQGA